MAVLTIEIVETAGRIVVDGRDTQRIVIVGRNSWFIDIPVVWCFSLTGGGDDEVSSIDASPSSESFVD